MNDLKMKAPPEDGRPTGERPTLYQRVKEVLALAAQIVITAPLKLPPRVVQGAQYLALLIGLLDSLDRDAAQPAGDAAEKKESDDAP